MPKAMYFFLWAICICVGVACAGGWLYFEHLYTQADRVYQVPVSSPVQTPPTQPEDTQQPTTQPPNRELPWQELQQKFPQIVGWIEGAGLNYPVVQGEDNSFFLNHLADGTENPLGAIFLDYNNRADFSDRVSIIYGHNAKEQRMFGALKGYMEPDFYKEHPQLYLYTPSETFVVELFACVQLDARTESYAPLFGTEQQTMDFIEHAIEHSLFQADVSPTAQDHVLLLSTCSSQSSHFRLAVLGVLKQKTIP